MFFEQKVWRQTYVYLCIAVFFQPRRRFFLWRVIKYGAPPLGQKTLGRQTIAILTYSIDPLLKGKARYS
jgi:hypothetical protein